MILGDDEPLTAIDVGGEKLRIDSANVKLLGCLGVIPPSNDIIHWIMICVSKTDSIVDNLNGKKAEVHPHRNSLSQLILSLTSRPSGMDGRVVLNFSMTDDRNVPNLIYHMPTQNGTTLGAGHLLGRKWGLDLCDGERLFFVIQAASKKLRFGLKYVFLYFWQIIIQIKLELPELFALRLVSLFSLCNMEENRFSIKLIGNTSR